MHRSDDFAFLYIFNILSLYLEAGAARQVIKEALRDFKDPSAKPAPHQRIFKEKYDAE